MSTVSNKDYDEILPVHQIRVSLLEAFIIHFPTRFLHNVSEMGFIPPLSLGMHEGKVNNGQEINSSFRTKRRGLAVGLATTILILPFLATLASVTTSPDHYFPLSFSAFDMWLIYLI